MMVFAAFWWGLELAGPTRPNQPQHHAHAQPQQAAPAQRPTAHQIAARHEEPAPLPQIGAEGEIYDPPFFRKNLGRPDGSGGFGPMASNDFGSDLDIPTVIRNLSD